jgi:hypothetical protein
MAITVTHQGSSNSKTTQSSLTTAANVAASVGQLIVVTAACLANATAPACSDTKGNVYTLAKTLPFNASGNSVCVFWAPCTSALVFSTDTVTVNFGVSSTAQVIDIWNCGGLATTSPVDVNVSTTGNSATPSLASGTLANASEAVFGIIAANGPIGDTFTVDTGNGWSSAAPTNHAGTTGGAQTSNIEIGTEIQIVSATSSVTAAPTITSRQWGEIVISFTPPAVTIPPFLRTLNISQAVNRAATY